MSKDYEYQQVYLKYIDYIELDYDYYLYVILVDNQEVGRITFRLGDDKQHFYHGHIGYEIEPIYRGHHYSYQACMALVPLIRQYRNDILITCSPENIASKKTIQKLGAEYIGTYPIPGKLKASFPKGENKKEVYRWHLP